MSKHKQEVERELSAAKSSLRAAQARYKRAVDEMDEILKTEALAEEQRKAAADIKAYQKSEVRKRAGL